MRPLETAVERVVDIPFIAAGNHRDIAISLLQQFQPVFSGYLRMGAGLTR
ncbi:MAG: hypothetical protein ACLR31_21405 [Escherichia coli]